MSQKIILFFLQKTRSHSNMMCYNRNYLLVLCVGLSYIITLSYRQTISNKKNMVTVHRNIIFVGLNRQLLAIFQGPPVTEQNYWRQWSTHRNVQNTIFRIHKILKYPHVYNRLKKGYSNCSNFRIFYWYFPRSTFIDFWLTLKFPRLSFCRAR